MPLLEEIAAARKEIVTEGYEMSIGELVNLYRDNELQISPEYQRLFRWDVTRKARLIESILLGLPLPPIFVYQRADGVWELIDGLQRVSTLLEFIGILKDAYGNFIQPSRLEGTTFLPSLNNVGWEPSTQDGVEGIGSTLQIQIKRARLRVEILKEESDPLIKYELFQRLNTGGVNLSQQEVRNSVGYMVDPAFQSWLITRAETEFFENTIDQTPNAKERQAHVELALRFFAFRNVEYKNGLDVHEYLDAALIQMTRDAPMNRKIEEAVFNRTFALLDSALGSKTFKRWDGQAFTGAFLMSVFEVVALGVSRNIDAIERMDLEARSLYIQDKCKDLWADPTFVQYSGAGVRGTTRLAKLLPMAQGYFQP
ncbi:DUF262 domain-containing protein [Comamonas sp. CAH-2]|uniref:GmrSD restriction endonuclease domain-containing protein n=1 Tax=Comamonas sp. CAH-2 TaxID=2605745 RepID=UPI0012AD8E0F|nr:DUF262 domain-containing protein [Comamonas sp. CAH-2]MRT18824.1 DUF262 domain-containing protein [Comamonas sp. CAH-2]